MNQDVSPDDGKLIPCVPLLIENALTITKIFVVSVAILTAMVSYLAGATILDIGLRTGIAVLIVGIIGWFINWLIAKFLIEITLKKLQQEVDELKGNSEESSMEVEA